MNLFNFQSQRERSTHGGFTLIEMLVVLGIFSIFTTIVLVKQGSFNRTVALTNLAHDVAGSIRKAQIFGIGVKQNSVGFNVPYGINFTSDQDKYRLFVESDYDPVPPLDFGIDYWGSGTEGVIIEEFTLNRGYVINDVCLSGLISGSVNDPCISDGGINVNISFIRPDPEAYILTANGLNRYSTAEIIVESSTDSSQMKVVVNSTGRISVESL